MKLEKVVVESNFGYTKLLGSMLIQIGLTSTVTGIFLTGIFLTGILISE